MTTGKCICGEREAINRYGHLDSCPLNQDSERDKQIKIACRHMKLKLKQRGDDPSSYNQKYLMERATKLVDEYFQEYGEYPYRKLEGQE